MSHTQRAHERQTATAPADSVPAMTAIRFAGGTIRTMDAARPLAPELLVEDGRVAARTSARPVEVDLRGRCLLPAFSDPHVHFPSWALVQRQVRLEGTRSLEEA